MTERPGMMAACGLDCGSCDMREATTDPELARRIAEWFQQELGQEVLPEEIRCAGCHGDRNQHWSADCWILQCCVDQHGLHDCSQCGEFPCARLEAWAAQNQRYTAALDRLRSTRDVP